MIDAHDDEIGAAKPGRKVIVAEPCRATHTGPQQAPRDLTPGTIGIIATYPRGTGSRAVIGVDFRIGSGTYRLRVERDQWCNLDLEPGRG